MVTELQFSWFCSYRRFYLSKTRLMSHQTPSSPETAAAWLKTVGQTWNLNLSHAVTLKHFLVIYEETVLVPSELRAVTVHQSAAQEPLWWLKDIHSNQPLSQDSVSVWRQKIISADGFIHSSTCWMGAERSSCGWSFTLHRTHQCLLLLIFTERLY